MADPIQTTRHAGDEFVFYNGGRVVIMWVDATQIGYALFMPGDDEPYLIRKDFGIFEKSLNRDHCIYEGQIA